EPISWRAQLRRCRRTLPFQQALQNDEYNIEPSGRKFARRAPEGDVTTHFLRLNGRLTATFGLRSSHHNRDATGGRRKFTHHPAAARYLQRSFACRPQKRTQ